MSSIRNDKTMYEILSDRSILTISGEDRIIFMQGLITKDCLRLQNNQLIYTLLLSPHGKYLVDFFLLNQGDHYLIDIASNLKDDFITKIKLYRLRKKIEISVDESLAVCVAERAGLLQKAYADPRSDKMGFRSFISKDNLSQSDNHFYHQKRIELIIPEGYYDMVRESSFPLEYGFDKINAIDFDKGCYVGQELIARTHFKGEIRKRLYLLESEKSFPPKGTEIIYENKRIGVMGSSFKNNGLALLRVEDVLNNKINSLIINDIEYKIQK